MNKLDADILRGGRGHKIKFVPFPKLDDKKASIQLDAHYY